MIHIKPTVQYDTLYSYLERDLSRLKKLRMIDFSDEFYRLRDYLFVATDLEYTLNQLATTNRLPSVMNALYGQTVSLDRLSPQHKDYWTFIEEWVYTVCATEMLIGKQFLDFKATFLKLFTEYSKQNICKKSDSSASLAWDANI